MSQPGVRTLALILCMFTACDAGEKPAPPAPIKPRTVPAAAAQQATGPDVTYLSADSDLVIDINVPLLRQSKLWAPDVADLAKRLVPGFAGCDYDPLSEMSSIVIGLPLETQLYVFVMRGIDRDKALRCLHTAKVESNPTVTFDGDFVTLRSESGAASILTFVDAKTMVLQRSRQATKATLRQALQLGAPLRANLAFDAALMKLPTTAAVRMASRPGSEQLAAKWKESGSDVKAIDGTLILTDRVQMQFALVLGSSEEATQLANMTRAQLASPQVKQMLDAKARSQGDTMTLDIGMTEAQLHSMINLMGAMLLGG